MRKNHSKIVCIKLVHLPYLYIWCTVTLISNSLVYIICNRCSRSKFIDFIKGKNDFRCFDIISCLLAGQVPDFKTFRLNISLCVCSIERWFTNVLWFDLCCRRGSLHVPEFWSGGDTLFWIEGNLLGGLCGKQKLSKGFGRVLKLYVTFADKIEYSQLQLVVRTSVFAHKQNNEVQNICQDDDVGSLVPEIFDQ